MLHKKCNFLLCLFCHYTNCIMYWKYLILRKPYLKHKKRSKNNIDPAKKKIMVLFLHNYNSLWLVYNHFTSSVRKLCFCENKKFEILVSAYWGWSKTSRNMIFSKNFRRLGRSTGSGGGREKGVRSRVNDIDISPCM